jgi:hypothetical protein
MKKHHEISYYPQMHSNVMYFHLDLPNLCYSSSKMTTSQMNTVGDEHVQHCDVEMLIFRGDMH